jgi:hypothetical protein
METILGYVCQTCKHIMSVQWGAERKECPFCHSLWLLSWPPTDAEKEAGLCTTTDAPDAG